MPKDSTRLIPFTWQSVGGEHDLTIKVDPEDAIVEKYEDNNEKTKRVDVDTEWYDVVSTRQMCSLLPLIIIAIILAIIVIIIKKRGSFLGLKPGGGGGGEEY